MPPSSDFRLLGPVEVLRGDRPAEVPRPRHRALLGLMLLHRGRFLPIAQIIEELWGGASPASARAQVQSSVSALRTVLGDDAALVHDRLSGYCLRITDDQVDLGRFEAAAAAARHSRDPETIGDLLRTALDQWRGQALGRVNSSNADSDGDVVESIMTTSAGSDSASASMADAFSAATWATLTTQKSAER